MAKTQEPRAHKESPGQHLGLPARKGFLKEVKLEWCLEAEQRRGSRAGHLGRGGRLSPAESLGWLRPSGENRGTCLKDGSGCVCLGPGGLLGRVGTSLERRAGVYPHGWG